jgi:pSer/pThr/pTyr-binding forkhead associated (FHA) protein
MRERTEDPTGTTVIDFEPQVDPRQIVGDPGVIHVEVVGGPMDGDRRRLAGTSFTIGRTSGNDLSLPLDPRVSARHARISRDGEQCWLEDLGSSNGTFLGKRRVTERVAIGPGAIFVLGGTYLELMPF